VKKKKKADGGHSRLPPLSHAERITNDGSAMIDVAHNLYNVFTSDGARITVKPQSTLR
jgi:hypothetical protein